jgi:para-nitrobenzyl esterase
MHKAWIDFARSGQPGWAPYTPATRATMNFALTSTLSQDPRHEQRIAWEGIR